ncbi:MAG: hypothetical protein H6953_05885 [Chromatiaceae bacterium]|nr:hypothetical protein [Chromatiaceae bacterium]MCP5314914.1 hypothetical protein [Chromatiaceae bacterium]
MKSEIWSGIAGTLLGVIVSGAFSRYLFGLESQQNSAEKAFAAYLQIRQVVPDGTLNQFHLPTFYLYADEIEMRLGDEPGHAARDVLTVLNCYKRAIVNRKDGHYEDFCGAHLELPDPTDDQLQALYKVRTEALKSKFREAVGVHVVVSK